MSQVDGEAQKREETNETFQKCIETFETETMSPAERHWKQRSYHDVIIRNMFICYAGKKGNKIRPEWHSVERIFSQDPIIVSFNSVNHYDPTSNS